MAARAHVENEHRTKTATNLRAVSTSVDVEYEEISLKGEAKASKLKESGSGGRQVVLRVCARLPGL